jgi:glycosyltransferase involved in cell wall biosynthesis
MKFSFIVVNYNNFSYLRECLNSIFSLNRFFDFEVIFVDDNSTDNSDDISKKFLKYNNFSFIKNPKNLGLVSSWKIGLNYSLGKYIVFIDSDDILITNHFEEITKIIFNNPNTDIFLFNYYENNSYKKIFLEQKTLSKDIFLGYSLLSWEKSSDIYLPPTRWAKVYKKEILGKNLDLIDNRITIGEDSLANFVWYSLSNEITIIPLPIYRYNTQNSNSIMRKKRKDYIEKIEVLYQNFNTINSNLNLKRSKDISLYFEKQVLNYLHYFVFTNFQIGTLIKNIKRLKKITNRISFITKNLRSILLIIIYNII